MAAQDWPPAVAHFSQLQQLLADGRNVSFFRRQRPAKGDRDGIRNCAREFREIAPALEGEDRAPKPVEPYRYDRRFGVPRDDLIAAPEPEERSAPRKLTLGKEADDFAGAYAGRRLAHGVLRFALADRNTADRVEERMQIAIPINPFIDDEADRPAEGELKHDRVDPGDVIRQKKNAARRHLFAPNRGDAIEDAAD